MNTKDIANELKKLDQLTIDCSILLNQAEDKVSDEDLKHTLQNLKEECDSNIKHLGELIQELGDEPPSYASDTKGLLMQGYVALRGMLSNKGVMEALDTNTVPLTKAYENILTLELPQNIKEAVQNIFNIVKKHAQVIREQTQAL